MDRFTRNYLIGLGVLVAAGLLWWLSSLDFLAGNLNGRLQEDPLVAGYAYPFRVRSVDDGIAQVYTPRTASMPATRFLAVIRPELARLAPDHPDVVAAEQRLAEVQARARSVVMEHPDVREVRWVLDRQWYESRGVTL